MAVSLETKPSLLLALEVVPQPSWLTLDAKPLVHPQENINRFAYKSTMLVDEAEVHSAQSIVYGTPINIMSSVNSARNN